MPKPTKEETKDSIKKKPAQKEEPKELTAPEALLEIEAEKPKPALPKPPVARNPFANLNQFRGGKWGNVFNKQRPGRAAARGR